MYLRMGQICADMSVDMFADVCIDGWRIVEYAHAHSYGSPRGDMRHGMPSRPACGYVPVILGKTFTDDRNSG